MRVIVTDGSTVHALAIIRSLGKRKIETWAVAQSKPALGFYSRFCKGGVFAPGPDKEEEYIRFLHKLVSNGHFDLLIPVGYKSTHIIARNRKVLEPYIKIEIADCESIELALNKRLTYGLAEKIGVPCPRTTYPETLEQALGLAGELEYPVVIKGLFEAGGQIVEYPSNKEEFIEKYTSICRQYGYSAGQLPMVQEYVRGETHSFAAVYQHGVCKRIFMFKELRSVPVTGGSASYAESFYDSKLKEYGTRMLNALHWHGVAHVEFKMDAKTRSLKLMEVNPKFWASIDVALTSGVEFPFYLCRMAAGEDLPYSEEYNQNLKFHFPFSRELQHVKSNPRAAARIILDCLNPGVKSNVWFSDLVPNLLELGTTLASILFHFMPDGIQQLLKRKLRL